MLLLGLASLLRGTEAIWAVLLGATDGIDIARWRRRNPQLIPHFLRAFGCLFGILLPGPLNDKLQGELLNPGELKQRVEAVCEILRVVMPHDVVHLDDLVTDQHLVLWVRLVPILNET